MLFRARPYTFNAGVMLINLQRYCTMDIWGQVKLFARTHATPGTRLYAALDRSTNGKATLGDNDVIVIVAGMVSHYVGAEWNCRHPSAYNTPFRATAGNGKNCRIRHMHEVGKRHERIQWLWKSDRITCHSLNDRNATFSDHNRSKTQKAHRSGGSNSATKRKGRSLSKKARHLGASTFVERSASTKRS
jgi:hypothetical protein